MNKIKKILSIVSVLVCVCVLSLTTHAAENQNKNYLSDLRVCSESESNKNELKDFKPDQHEYSVVVSANDICIGGKLSEDAPENSWIVAYYEAVFSSEYSWDNNVRIADSDSGVTAIGFLLEADVVEGSPVEIRVGVEGNVDKGIQEDLQTYMIYLHKKGTKTALLTTKLEALSEVNALTLADKDAVAEARTAYDELTDAQKKLMAPSLIQKLTDSETKIAALTKAEEDKKQDTATSEKKPATKPQAKTVAVKKGTTFTVKGYKYKVTSNLAKNPTVTVVGYKNKKLTKVNVASVVKYKKVNFKVTAIGNKAFKNQKKAKSIVIGKNAKTIGIQAFAGDSKVKKITVKSTVLSKVGSKAFSGINKKAVIKVPAKKLKSYKKIMKNKGQRKTVKITK